MKKLFNKIIASPKIPTVRQYRSNALITAFKNPSLFPIVLMEKADGEFQIDQGDPFIVFNIPLTQWNKEMFQYFFSYGKVIVVEMKLLIKYIDTFVESRHLFDQIIIASYDEEIGKEYIVKLES